ncbi:hypothetical protein VPH35_068380 [Triticum aestivum]
MPIMLSARKRKVWRVEGEEQPPPALHSLPLSLPHSSVTITYWPAGPVTVAPLRRPETSGSCREKNRGNRGTAEGLRLDLLQNFRPSISPAGLVSAVVEAGGGGSCIGSRLILLLARR